MDTSQLSHNLLSIIKPSKSSFGRIIPGHYAYFLDSVNQSNISKDSSIKLNDDHGGF